MTDSGDVERGTSDAVDAFHDALLDDDPVALYDRAPCGYLTTLSDGTIVKANQTLVTFSGYSRDELLTKRFVDLLTGGGRIYHETHYAPLLQLQGSVRALALELVCRDGSRLPVLVNAVLERDEREQPILIRIAVFEATERRSYERELLRAKEEAERAERRSAALARTLQQTLIPPVAPRIPGLEVAAAYRPAGHGDEVGGDFYDVFQIDDDDWFVVVGDVQGKGAAAAVVTTLVRHTIRAAAVLDQDPADILDTVNSVLLHDETERFCTLVIVRLMRIDTTWRAIVSLGGHPHPLLCRAGQGPVRVGNPGVLIGVWDTVPRADSSLELRPGDVLMLYTDGLTEARRGPTFLGEHGLLELAKRHAGSAESLVSNVVADVIEYQHGVTRDDIAVVAIGVPPSA